MEKWMVVLVAAGFLIPYGTVLAVTGNIHGAEYVRQQEKEAAGKYRILLDREENGGYLSLEEYLPSVLAAQISPDSEMEALKAQAVILRSSCVAGGKDLYPQADGRRKRNFGIKSGSGPETEGRAEKNMGKNGISGKIQPSGRGSDPDQ